MRYLSFAALTLLALLSVASASQAAIVNYTGTDYNAGTLSGGQSGKITTNPLPTGSNPTTAYDELKGYLAPETEIIFTYTACSCKPLTGNDSVLYGTGDWGYYNSKGKDQAGSAFATATKSAYNSSSTVTAGNGLPLVFATARFLSTHQGQITITNDSPVAAYFLAALEASSAFSNLVTTYTTISFVSEVPLPASMQAFLLALVVLFAFAYQKKMGAAKSRIG